MDLLKSYTQRFAILIILFILSLSSACSTPLWFPLKKSPPHQAKMKELVGKDVVIIDREEYVKVQDRSTPGGGNQTQSRYIPVKEYLSNRQAYTPSTVKSEEDRAASFPASKTSTPLIEGQSFVVATPPPPLSELRRKVLVAHFQDQSITADESSGDWLAEKLVKEVERSSQRILMVDFQRVKDFLSQKGVDVAELESAKVLLWLHEVFGIQALVSGTLSGPYVFITKSSSNPQGIVSATTRIQMRLIDTFSGRTLKDFSNDNASPAVREKGSFAEEKAKIKAMEVAIHDLGRSLAKELDRLDWVGRIVKVEGDEVYLNAGRLTGIKVGDTLEVFRPGETGKIGERKGRIQISAFLGIDASIGMPVSGNAPDVNDVIKPSKQEGT